ncbi:MAG: metalloregulator ArsR/SmtB family transcription factor [Eubacteriales bacterium]|nr:metalloregulator ArsR/SmtB family transcription factor [Eubacteriales bacterium]
MNDSIGLPVCGENHVDRQHEEEIRTRLPSEDQAVDAAAIFAQLADTTRVRLLSMLAASDMCVCEMADLLGMSQPAVSHHLRVLRQFDAVRFRKWGQRTMYYISDNETGELVRRLLSVVGCGKEQTDEQR